MIILPLVTSKILKEKSDSGDGNRTTDTVGAHVRTGQAVDITKLAGIVEVNSILAIWIVGIASSAAVSQVVDSSIGALALSHEEEFPPKHSTHPSQQPHRYY